MARCGHSSDQILLFKSGQNEISVVWALYRKQASYKCHIQLFGRLYEILGEGSFPLNNLIWFLVMAHDSLTTWTNDMMAGVVSPAVPEMWADMKFSNSNTDITFEHEDPAIGARLACLVGCCDILVYVCPPPPPPPAAQTHGARNRCSLMIIFPPDMFIAH